MLTSAFTCTGPYAILIMLGIKRVENRSMMPVPEKGRCAVGCSKSFCREEFGNFVQWASKSLSEDDFARIPAWSDVKEWPGAIVGACDYVCRERSGAEAWDEGYQYWWDLSDIAAFDAPIRCRGNVGMWQMTHDLAIQVTAADFRVHMVGAKVSSVADAAKVFRAAVSTAGTSEGFFVLPLDVDHRVLSEPVLVSLGTASTATVRPFDVLSVAFKVDAASVIVAHNHPSGRLEPSKEDLLLTAELKDICGRVNVEFLDHLIINTPMSAGDVEFLSLQKMQREHA